MKVGRVIVDYFKELILNLVSNKTFIAILLFAVVLEKVVKYTDAKFIYINTSTRNYNLGYWHSYLDHDPTNFN